MPDEFPGLSLIPEGQTLYLRCDRCHDWFDIDPGWGVEITVEFVVEFARKHLESHDA